MAKVEVDIKKLLSAGAHFGHNTSKWHPKMAEYIHSKKNGNHIIDLTRTVEKLDPALAFITETVQSGRQIMFVGTKRQAKDVLKTVADETNMPYVTERWLGGTLTNWQTISARVKHLQDLEEKMDNGTLAAKFNKLEVQRFQEEIDDMNITFGGIKNLHGKPGALFVVDMVHEANAIKEARKINIPVVAIADTNADPSLVQFPIPANDDAIKTIQLISEYVKMAIEQGKNAQKSEKKDKEEIEEEE
ncbi:MAG: 30S ribosomal protein S2 [bacterium]|jgi:small subunit ribosomal protein S2